MADAKPFPRHTFLRWIMSKMARGALWLLTDLRIEGEENFPLEGPLLLIGNHFSFIDPVCFVAITPAPVDYIGGAAFPNAPNIVKFIPKLWGYIPVHRGGSSKEALEAASKILDSGGMLGMFPEAGSWASVLRPARPGAPFIASQTGTKVLAIGIDGSDEVFASLAKFKRAKLTLRVGKPFGPFSADGKGRDRRKKLNKIGDVMMREVAALIPPEKHGYYSEDPEVRAAAKGTEVYPWALVREGEVEGSKFT